jgi:hypothetical protein
MEELFCLVGALDMIISIIVFSHSLKRRSAGVRFWDSGSFFWAL